MRHFQRQKTVQYINANNILLPFIFLNILAISQQPFSTKNDKNLEIFLQIE